MRKAVAYSLPLFLLLLAGCAGDSSNSPVSQRSSLGSNSSVAAEAETAVGSSASAQKPSDAAAAQKVSLNEAEEAEAQARADARRIIRNAELKLEVASPTDGQRRIASVAESHGGFVVTSESKQRSGSDGAKAYEVVTMQLRVPSAQFDAVIGEIRAVAGGAGVVEEKITGQDVTEEYIDLESRARTQKALEAQLLELLRRSGDLADAVTLQRELASVRTEIEKIEGRRRFLENQSSLSTISVTVQPAAPLVSTTGFFRSVGSAFGQGIDIAAAVTLFLIKALLALLPVAVILGLPAFFLLRYLLRRARRRPAAPPQPPAQEFRPPAP